MNISSKKKAGEVVVEMGNIQADIIVLTAEMMGELALLRSKYLPEISKLNRDLKKKFQAVASWSIENKDEWCKKTLKLNGGKVYQRSTPKKLVISADEKRVIDFLREQGLDRFVRLSYALDKGQLKDNPGVVGNIDGVEIVDGDEMLYVEPDAGSALKEQTGKLLDEFKEISDFVKPNQKTLGQVLTQLAEAEVAGS